jgi:hypothetical protein
MDKKQIVFSLLGIELRLLSRPALKIVAVPTQLSRLKILLDLKYMIYGSEDLIDLVEARISGWPW